MGYALYEEGGLLVEKGNVLILLLATFATVSDSFMRLLFHKYKEEVARLKEVYPNIEGTKQLHHSKSGETPSLRERIGEAIGIGGFLPLFILIFTYFRMADLIIYFIFLYNILKCAAVSFIAIKGAIRLTEKVEKECIE